MSIRPSIRPTVRPVVGVKSDMYPEYRPVFSAKVSQPTGLQKYAENWFVKEWVKTRNLWQRSDIIRIYGSHTNDNGEALINWKNPGTFDATAYNSPVHTAYEGFQFNGTDNYVHHNWVPSVNGVNFVQNSASQILYIRTNINSNGAGHGTLLNQDSKYCFIYPRNGDDEAYVGINEAGSDKDVNPNGSGLFVGTRTGANVNQLYRNKILIINGTDPSTGVPTHSPYTGCYDDDDVPTGFRADQVLAEIWMDGCVQDDVNEIDRIINGFATILGVNVY